MKKLLTIVICISCMLLSACGYAKSIGIIGGADGPTAVLISENGATASGEKKVLRMLKADGKLYFDSGKVSNMTSRCGTLDGELTRVGKEYEIPQKDNQCNFAGAKGYQNATSLTKEVPTEDGWAIFKMFDDPQLDMSVYKYCFYMKGRLPNANEDSELVVLTEDKNITFDALTKQLLGGKYNPDDDKYATTFMLYDTSDELGLTLNTKNVTPNGLTLVFEQFGGNATGDLQTGGWYCLEVSDGNGWKTVGTKQENAVWNDIAYKIFPNDITELDVDWSWLYGELEPGFYRISKEVMDFRQAGDFDKKQYQAYFTVSQ